MAEFDWEAFHPHFDKIVDRAAVDFTNKMKHYKPRVSHFGYEQSQNTSKSVIIKLGRNL